MLADIAPIAQPEKKNQFYFLCFAKMGNKGLISYY